MQTYNFIHSFFISGCSINDDILNILSPALVRIKKVNLGRNPITAQGWQFFKNQFKDALTVGEVGLTHLSLNAISDSGSGGGSSSKMILHSAGMGQLATILPMLEEVDLSGQTEIGVEGWNNICDEIM